MVASAESGRLRTSNKEAISDIIQNLPVRGDDCEQMHPANTKILRRATLKIDFYLIPIMGMFCVSLISSILNLYFSALISHPDLLSFMDRSNIGNAKVAGLTKSLHMTEDQFSIALTINFIPYILVDIPMNLLIKRVGANVTIPTMVVLWGIVCASQGAVHSYHSLLICRFFLGVIEGGLFPGIVLLFSAFYKRHAMQFRFAMMYSVTSLAGAFSGLLAFGIENLNGKCGISGWQWIFILEGAFTSAFGLATIFFVPSSPRNIKFLTKEEREVYCEDLADNWSGDADTDGKYDEVFSWSEVASVFTDAPHVLIMAIPFFFVGVTIYGLANFTPTVVSALGHSPNRTQLLTVPPYACSFVFSIISSYFCDKYKSRGLMATFCALLAAAGYAIFLASRNKESDYGALFLQIVGIYSIGPCLVTWNANNIQPHYRRATAVGLGVTLVNLGGIVSAWLYTDAPRFHKATSINLSFSLGIAVASTGLIFFLRTRNAGKRRKVQRLLQLDEQGKGMGVGTHPRSGGGLETVTRGLSTQCREIFT